MNSSTWGSGFRSFLVCPGASLQVRQKKRNGLVLHITVPLQIPVYIVLFLFFIFILIFKYLYILSVAATVISLCNPVSYDDQINEPCKPWILLIDTKDHWRPPSWQTIQCKWQIPPLIFRAEYLIFCVKDYWGLLQTLLHTRQINNK